MWNGKGVLQARAADEEEEYGDYNADDDPASPV